MESYAPEKEVVAAQLKALYGTRLASLEFYRPTSQTQWREIFKKHFVDYDDDEVLWFMQNDDHPFVDVDEAVWKEGLERMRSDTSQYKTMYPSHWPEILKLSGKMGERIEVCGAYARTTMTLLDAV